MIQEHKYRGLSPEQYEELFSNFLIDSWSYSKVATFSRHEKAFEMTYIYREPFKQSASSIAGSAYHKACEYYFAELKEGRKKDIVSLQEVALDYIDNVKPNQWKIQKTTPSIEECINKATETTIKYLNNFFSDISIFDEIEEIIDVELYCDEFLTINGVDIALPCHAKIDLIFKSKSGKIVIADHKGKSFFTDEKELKFSIGKQAITYVNCFEQKTGIIVDEVWFIENKDSKNRDNSPQLNCFKIEIDKDTRRLYESLLYEPLKRMMEAVSNPDHVYLINESDNFVDKAEIFEFWCKTQIAEIGEFNIPENKAEIIKKRLKKIRDTTIGSIDPKTIRKFRENAASFITYDLTNKNMTPEEKIEHTLRILSVPVSVAKTFSGYSSNTFLLEIGAGKKISDVFKYKLDIANALGVSSVRIAKDLYVYENKSYVSVESEKQRESILSFDPSYLKDSKIPIGLDNFGNTVFWDLDNQSTPHALICGGTGSGKSVAIKSILEYALLSKVEEIVILDPKFEFINYKSNSKISVYTDIEAIENKAAKLVEEMNSMIKQGATKRIMVILDEFADAYMMSKKGAELDIREEVQDGFYAPKKMKGVFGTYMSDPIHKMKVAVVGRNNSLEENIQSLLQKGRSSGFRMILATQRADTNTIKGNAKVNLPVQICFKVQKEVDSRVVIDEAGAESLAGNGDGLIKSPQYNGVVRFQGFYKQ